MYSVSGNTLRHGSGRVLHIGVSYYNNEYLTASLRQRGWKADLLFNGYEAAEEFVHDLPKQKMQDCFQPVAPLFPKTTNLLASILEAVGKSWPRKYEAPSKDRETWESVLALSPDQLEKILSDENSSVADKFFCGEVRRASLRFLEQLDNKEEADLPPLLMPLALNESCGLLRKVLLRFLTALRPDHAELSPLLAIVKGEYDILHFTGAHSMRFLYYFALYRFGENPIGWDIALLKRLGLKIVYSNTACFDGVLPSTFRRHELPVCELCNWNNSEWCNDKRNSSWGKMRNALADYQITLGGNRDDYNRAPRIHEVPGFYCLDKKTWAPDRNIPEQYVRTSSQPGIIRLYHAVGNLELRSTAELKNIKCTHIYIPIVHQLQAEGLPVELDLVTGVPNREVVWRQIQADIICDQLTFGWFGANAREGMMLGKPVICYLRPQWLESVRSEIPDYAAELPIISATPDTVAAVIRDLVINKEKRLEIGRRGREFAIKWHDRSVGARQVEKIYNKLLQQPPTASDVNGLR